MEAHILGGERITLTWSKWHVIWVHILKDTSIKNHALGREHRRDNPKKSQCYTGCKKGNAYVHDLMFVHRRFCKFSPHKFAYLLPISNFSALHTIGDMLMKPVRIIRENWTILIQIHHQDWALYNKLTLFQSKVCTE